jgi:threonyl-tRNA synthetase
LPKGCIKRTFRAILEKHKRKAGYEQVVTPHIGEKIICYFRYYAKYGADSFQPINSIKEKSFIET